MTFEEFKDNLDSIRKYNKRLSKYKVSWLNDEITQAIKKGEHSFFIPEQERKDKRKEYKRRKRNIEKIELPPHLIEFEWLIAGIIHDVINVENENDLTDDKINKTLGLLSGVPFFEDTETNKTFKILNYFYFEGYTVKHIAKLFGYGIDPNTQEAENRDGVYYQINKGTAELFKLYADKYPDEISPSATTRKSESNNNNTQEETHEQHEDRDE